MNNLENMAKILLITGAFILLAGFIMLILSKFTVTGFRLPGDIFYKGEKYSVYFPIVTCLVISFILTVLLNLFFRR